MVKKLIFLAGIVLAFTPFVIFPVCETLRPDGTHMNCFYSGIFITLMGAMISIFALTAMKKIFEFFCVLLSGACAVMCWLVPNGIIKISRVGLCANLEHPCRALTMPAVGIIAGVIFILCIVKIIMNFIGARK